MGTKPGCGEIRGSSTLAVCSLPLFLISITFLWELECRDGTNVGLAAGRYSGYRRPDLYRTPHALHRVFGPVGPSLHCGVFVTSQCVHFFDAATRCREVLCSSTESDTIGEALAFWDPSSMISLATVSWDNFFLLSLFFLKFEVFLEVEEIESHGFTVEDLTRLDLAWTGMTMPAESHGRNLTRLDLIGTHFPPEHLLLSSTETGLCVWKAPYSWASVNLCWWRITELEVSSGSCFFLRVLSILIVKQSKEWSEQKLWHNSRIKRKNDNSAI